MIIIYIVYEKYMIELVPKIVKMRKKKNNNNRDVLARTREYIIQYTIILYVRVRTHTIHHTHIYRFHDLLCVVFFFFFFPLANTLHRRDHIIIIILLSLRRRRDRATVSRRKIHESTEPLPNTKMRNIV